MQKINHFAGMLEICRKRSMARNLANMAALLPKEYAFFPKSFVLPDDMPALTQEIQAASRKSGKTWIIKPDAGCQGRGISLVQTVKQAEKVCAGSSSVNCWSACLHL